jgi:O-antigen/teichoic acid export membrane protein
MESGAGRTNRMATIAEQLKSPTMGAVAKHDVVREHLRGSSLLLVGRCVSVGLTFLAQVIVVRYLTTREYGAWAYGLSLVAFFQGFVSLGLDRSVTRFLPIYEEKQEYDKLFGTVLLVISSVLLTAGVIVAGFWLFPQDVARLLKDQHESVNLLLILIFLVPFEGLDKLMIGLFACFSKPRTIFFRRYVLAPGLRLAVVLLLVFQKSQVTFLAYGYLVASAVGIGIYSVVLFQQVRKKGLLQNFNWSSLKVPAREIFAFTLPLLSLDLVTIVMRSSDALMLGYFCDLRQVAYFRVVLPAAALNQIVMQSFTLLYTPTAARMFARDDHSGINKLYWKTAIWMAVLSFPIFAMTFSMARPLTLFLYGARYEQSGMILALLSFGYYVNVALGFNGLTLQVLGKIRYIVIINVIAAVTNVAVNLMLIPRYGALGAAIGTAATLVVHNILKQTGLRLASGISLFEKKYFWFYALLTLSAGCMFLAQFFSGKRIEIAVTLACVVTVLVLALSRKSLKIEETFPEALRFPLVKRFLA